jgi:hypothetical protein
MECGLNRLPLNPPGFAFAQKRPVTQAEAEDTGGADFFDVVLMIVLQDMLHRWRVSQEQRGDQARLEPRYAPELGPLRKKAQGITPQSLQEL